MKLGRSWTPEEDAVVRAHYGVSTLVEISTRVDRTIEAVKLRANKLGCKHPSARPRKSWSTSETETLATLWRSGVPILSIAEQLGRPEAQIKAKVAKLSVCREVVAPRKLRTWSKSLIAKAEALYLSGVSPEDIGNELGKTRNSVILRLNRSGVTRKTIVATPERLEIVQDRYQELTKEELATELDVSISTIDRMRCKLGLSKTPAWSAGDHQVLKDFYKTRPVQEVAKMVGRSEKAVRGAAHWHGYSRRRKEHTQPEIAVSAALSDLGVVYSRQHRLLRNEYDRLGRQQYYRPDFLLEASSVVIEVHGDYFHGNPIKFPNGPVNKMQDRAFRRDFRKAVWYSKNGYKLVVVWESECSDFEALKETLSDKIDNLTQTA